MPQLQLPIFPADATPINGQVAVGRGSGKVVYFYGQLPVFQHEEGDLASFRMLTSQMIDGGTIRVCEVARTFGVPLATVKRYVKLYREQGAKGFFAPRRRRSAAVLKGESQQRAQALLDAGRNVAEVGREIDVLADTLRKAIRAGRLRQPAKKKTRR